MIFPMLVIASQIIFNSSFPFPSSAEIPTDPSPSYRVVDSEPGEISAIESAKSHNPHVLIPQNEFMKGLVYEDWTENGYRSSGSDITLGELIHPMGVNWIEIMVACRVDNYPTTKIICGPQTGMPDDESVRHVIQTARNTGMRVMLKPQLFGSSPDDLSIPRYEGIKGSQAAWETWFGNYANMITHYAKLAKEEMADAFNIGTELKQTSRRESEWRVIVDQVRSVFNGPLVYGANWDEAEQIQWWDAVDYIGIDAYFPLTSSMDPSVDQLTHAWARRTAQLERLSEQWNRPVILTEIGYRSINGANKAPYDYRKEAGIDLQEQADCYQAVFNTFTGKNWLHGIFFWSWTVDPEQGGPGDSSYTIHNKPAEQVLLGAYSKSHGAKLILSR